MLKKSLSIIMCLCLLFGNIGNVFADNTDDESIDVQEIIQTCSQCVENELEIDSKIAVAYDRASGRVIWGKDENKRSAMASTTKIMTAIVTLENSNLEDVVKVSSKSAWTGGSSLKLKTNDEVKLEDLLYGLMLKSGNDAAVAIAEHVGGSVEGFAEMMNNKAKELGLIDTHFVTPHGLDDPEHYTTAKELAIITDYAMKNEKFAKIVSTKEYTICINGYSRQISNTNELLGVLNGVNGVKTGFTNNAGRCLVTSINRNGWGIIVVVLRADTKKIRTKDSVKIIEYIYKNYKQININEIVEQKFNDWCSMNKNRIVVNKGKNNNMNLKMSQLNSDIIPVKNTDIDRVDVDINALFYFESPVEKETIVGTIKVILNNEVIEIANIYNTNTIERKDMANYLKEFLVEIWGRSKNCRNLGT